MHLTLSVILAGFWAEKVVFGYPTGRFDLGLG
jgi:hypothetical protein